MTLRLLVTMPTAIVLDLPDIAALRAADASGSFGILPGHADFLTVLAVSVIAYRRADGQAGFCAVRRGLLTVQGGREVAVATREAVAGPDLGRLEREVIARFREAADAERSARTQAMRLHMQAIRRIERFLRPGGGGTAWSG